MTTQTKSSVRKTRLKPGAVAVTGDLHETVHGTDFPIDDSARRHMIEEAAYFLAAKRNFQAGSALADWLAAEQQIKVQLGE